MPDELTQRKDDHLRIVAEGAAAHTGTTLLECVQLVHQALPELALDSIDLSTRFFGKRLRLPFMITSMTGGTDHGARLNAELARMAGQLGIAFATGSQRVMLRYPERRGDFAVREHIPDGVLLGNIGAQQLREYAPEQITQLLHDIEADGLCVHLNPAHELAQDEGDRDFSGLLERIAQLTAQLDGRVLVKETGAGLSPQLLLALRDAGVGYVDVAGAGGTSWPKVELARAQTDEARAAGSLLADWGVPTAASTIAARAIMPPSATVVASGGIRTGLDCARAIACGADICGLAAPVLKAWLDGGADAVHALLARLGQELRPLLLLTSCKGVGALQGAPRVYTGQLAQWLAAWGLGENDNEASDG